MEPALAEAPGTRIDDWAESRLTSRTDTLPLLVASTGPGRRFNSRLNLILRQKRGAALPGSHGPDVVILRDDDTSLRLVVELKDIWRDMGSVAEAVGCDYAAGQDSGSVYRPAEIADSLEKLSQELVNRFIGAWSCDVDDKQDRAHVEWEWILANQEELRDTYPDIWIAVSGTSVVGFAETPEELIDQTEGLEDPFMYHVPGEFEPTVVA